jgi:hypothetical protein
MAAEAISILSGLADRGEEEAAVYVQQIADQLPPEMTLLAAHFDRLNNVADEAMEEGLH